MSEFKRGLPVLEANGTKCFYSHPALKTNGYVCGHFVNPTPMGHASRDRWTSTVTKVETNPETKADNTEFKNGDKVFDGAGCECTYIGINPLNDRVVVATLKGGIYVTLAVSEFKRVLEVGDPVVVSDQPPISGDSVMVFRGMFEGHYVVTNELDDPLTGAGVYRFAIHKDDVRG